MNFDSNLIQVIEEPIKSIPLVPCVCSTKIISYFPRKRELISLHNALCGVRKKFVDMRHIYCSQTEEQMLL